MPGTWELVSVLVILNFVVMASVTILLVGLDKAVGLFPLLLVFVVVLYFYTFRRS